MRTPVAHRLVELTALGLAAVGLAACGAMGGASSFASSSARAATAAATAAAKPAAARVAAHPTPTVVIGERQTGVGLVLTSAGRTLYTYGLDKGDGSHCTGACATTWPPLIVGTHGSLKSSVALPHALGTIACSAGMQVTYNGHPLYLYVGDKAPGETRGEAVKQVWFVATPDGQATMIAPRPTPRMTPPVRIHATAPPTARPLPAPVPATMTPPRMTVPPNPIPQSGGGDHDSDNFGGPNDGDGNV
jgi:predicted lipoprotein with Yx(FWY)xxD motif